MPFPNEHACRLRSPVSGAKTGRTTRVSGNGKTYSIITQQQTDGTFKEQSFRYAKDVWSVDEARAHCTKHNGISFEAATTSAMERLEYEHRLKEGKKEYLIIPRGEFDHPDYGKLAFNDKMMDEMISNFNNNALGETKPFIDQDHDQRGAAGWIIGLRKAMEGIFGAVEWTEVGIELLKKKIYRYFSPSIQPTYVDPQSGNEFHNVLRGGALTNMPFLKMLPEITLEEKGLVEIALSEITETGVKKMNILDELKKTFEIDETDEKKAVEAIKTKIAELTKLAEKGADTKELDALKVKVAELEKSVETKKTELKELSEKNPKPELEKKFDEAVKSNKSLSDKITIMERDKCVGKALSEGRMLPDSREKYEGMYIQNPQLMEEAINNMPKVIELAQKGNPNAPTEKVVEMSEGEKQLHKEFGHTEEDIKKYRDTPNT